MNDKTDDERDPRLLSGACALGAVSPEEARAYEDALADSHELRREAEGLTEAAGLLGASAPPVQPSAGLKQSLMAQIASTPQVAPTPQNAPVAEVSATGAPAVAAAGPAHRRARTRWFTRPVGIVVAAAAAVILFAGGTIVGGALTTPSAPEVTAASALAEITAAADSQRVSAPVTGGGTATVVWSEELGRSAVLVDGLPALDSTSVYEAWYIGADGATPAGIFDAAESGMTWHILDGDMSPGDTVGVTVEPAGGSEQPTTDPILVVPSA